MNPMNAFIVWMVLFILYLKTNKYFFIKNLEYYDD